MHPHPPIFSAADGLEHEPDEMVLVGPPGTGKTRAVIDHFLAPAVTRWAPRDVLGCSFTKAAAREMRDRIAKQVSGVADAELKQTCSTIHSEAYRLCRIAGLGGLWKKSKESMEHGEDIEQSWADVAEQCQERRGEAERLWGLARNMRPEELLPPGQKYSERQVRVMLARAIARQSYRPRYSEEQLAAEVLSLEADKRAAGMLDFTDMLAHALFLPSPERELMVVDEAQDLSPLQIALVRRWASKCARLTWVGDPDQGIYAFSGADGAMLTGLMRDSAIRTRRLAQSWRVPQAAHHMARGVILLNRNRVDAPYDAAERDGAVFEFDDPADALLQALEMDGSVFVLARTARALDAYAEMCVSQGIPFERERGGGSPLRQKVNIGILSALHDLLDGLSLSMDAALHLVENLRAKPKGRFSGTKKSALATIKDVGEREEWLSLRDLTFAGVNLADVLRPGTLQGALSVLDLREECAPLLRIYERNGIEALRETPRLKLTTMHSSKGLEAETVVVDLTAPQPSRMAVQGGERQAVEDERKVLYVALTRTKDTLILRRPDREEDLLWLLG